MAMQLRKVAEKEHKKEERRKQAIIHQMEAKKLKADLEVIKVQKMKLVLEQRESRAKTRAATAAWSLEGNRSGLGKPCYSPRATTRNNKF